MTKPNAQSGRSASSSSSDRTPLTLRNWRPVGDAPPDKRPDRNAIVNCGWGRLIFGHTFEAAEELAGELIKEDAGHRDIAFYIRDPHVVIAQAPQDIFLDPSHTFRLWLDQYRARAGRKPTGFVVRKARPRRDAEAIANIYKMRGMVPVSREFLVENRASRVITCFVAEDTRTEQVIGVAFGVDHAEAFHDPEQGSSLWALAVHANTPLGGIGEALSRHLAEHFKARGRAFMDLSVMHDNQFAIALYEKLGFQRVPVFTIKTKNSINQPLFVGPSPEEKLNPYAEIILDEARRRGISVKILDAENAIFQLTFGGRNVTCRESLSELTSAVAMTRCDDKAMTRSVLEKADLCVPAQINADDLSAVKAFLGKHRRVVVKPARGEQGNAVFVNLSTMDAVSNAIEQAKLVCDKVVVEQFVPGEDLRIVVIDGEVVAAAVRRPPEIVGNGKDNVRTLIEKLSRKRAAATGGESRIPLDRETGRCIGAAGFTFNDVPGTDVRLQVRNTANLHTGGTIHDVTDEISETLKKAAVAAADALAIPVVGLDFMVPDLAGDTYVIIEANERPGLANHEPRPTAQKFIDFLFPLTAKKPGDTAPEDEPESTNQEPSAA